MAIYLYSADIHEVETARTSGFVTGVVTSPALIQQTQQKGLEILEALVEIFDGHVFYQLTSTTLEQRIDEAWEAYDLRPDRVVIKLPSTTENLRMIKRLPEIDIAVTAVYSPMQAYVAAEAGAHYVMPYVNYPGTPSASVDAVVRISRMATLIGNNNTEILATHIDNLEVALQVLEAGANHICLPGELIKQVGDHPLTHQVIKQTPAVIPGFEETSNDNA